MAPSSLHRVGSLKSPWYMLGWPTQLLWLEFIFLRWIDVFLSSLQSFFLLDPWSGWKISFSPFLPTMVIQIYDVLLYDLSTKKVLDSFLGIVVLFFTEQWCFFPVYPLARGCTILLQNPLNIIALVQLCATEQDTIVDKEQVGYFRGLSANWDSPDILLEFYL